MGVSQKQNRTNHKKHLKIPQICGIIQTITPKAVRSPGNAGEAEPLGFLDFDYENSYSC